MLEKLVLVLDLSITAWTGPAYGFGYRTVRYATVTGAGTPGSSTGEMYMLVVGKLLSLVLILIP